MNSSISSSTSHEIGGGGGGGGPHPQQQQQRRPPRPRRSQAGQRPPVSRPNELVNKIASIDIWATERLYSKWQRHALAAAAGRPPEKHNLPPQPLFNYNASQPLCKRHRSSGRYFVASVAQQQQTTSGVAVKQRSDAFATLLEGDAPPKLLQHKCHMRRRAQSRPHEDRHQHHRHASQPRPPQHQHRHRRSPYQHGHHRHLSLSNNTEALRAEFRRSQPKQQQQTHQQLKQGALQPRHTERESQRTSDIDWPDSWPSIWGSSVPPKCAQQRGSGGSSNNDRLAYHADSSHDDSRGAQQQKQQWQNDRKHRSSNRRDGDASAASHYRMRQASKSASQKTVEALLTLDPVELMRTTSQVLAAHQSKLRDSGHNSMISQIATSPEHETAGSLLDSTKEQPTPQSQSTIDRSTYTIVKDITPISMPQPKHATRKRPDKNECQKPMGSGEYNVARLAKTERRKSETVQKLQKPVVWLIEDKSTQEQNASSQEDRQPVATAASQQKLSNLSRLSGVSRHRKKPPDLTHGRLGGTISCHNSIDGRSLQMLSTATYERENSTNEEELSDSDVHMRMARISNVGETACLKYAASQLLNIRMHSNAARPQDTLDGVPVGEFDVIHTHQEVGESKGVEPKTGSVTRHVQDAVVSAAKLLAARGFAGLVGARPSELGSDLNTTDTVGSAEDEDEDDDDYFEPEEDPDSLGYLDDLEEMDSEDEAEARETRRTKRTMKSDTGSQLTERTSSSSRPARPRRQNRGRGRRLKVDPSDRSLESGDEGEADDEDNGDAGLRQGQQKKAPPAKLVPMTQCPTTKHRIECYRTRSGHVKCYMTARHPVKCRVQDGRIVCKATVKPETSDLPYPCNAAWQC